MTLMKLFVTGISYWKINYVDRYILGFKLYLCFIMLKIKKNFGKIIELTLIGGKYLFSIVLNKLY